MSTLFYGKILESSFSSFWDLRLLVSLLSRSCFQNTPCAVICVTYDGREGPLHSSMFILHSSFFNVHCSLIATHAIQI